MPSSRLLLGALAIAIGAAACSHDSTTPSSPSPTPTGSVSSVSIPVGASTQGAHAYAPDQINVTAGTTVTWMNTDVVAHTATSDAGTFNSGTVPPGGQFSAAFATPGTFQYHCTIHPGMVGSVVVR